MTADGCGGGLRNGATTHGKSGGGGGGGGSRQAVLKKGPWTAAEDSILMEYVKKHGEGNWNAVQRNSGLMRCGKSCRLRWANHLRPNLKKGAFSPDEEKLITELHSKLGNKWARMASQLPGRTDNEIKNYWNTRVKRRQRAGLSIYPHEIKQKNRDQNHNQQQPYSFSSSSLSFFNPPMNLSTDSSYLPNTNQQFKLYRDNNGGLALSLSSPTALPSFPSPYSSSGSLPFNSLFPNNYYSSSFMELSSIQSSSSGNGSDFVLSRSNSGLLEDLLEESQALTQAEKSKAAALPKQSSMLQDTNECDRKLENSGWHAPPIYNSGHGGFTSEKPWEEPTSGYSSIGIKTEEEMNSMDEDLRFLLDSFPLSVPGNNDHWCEKTSGASSSVAVELLDHETTVGVPAATPEHDWTLGSCRWNNMPSIF